MRVGHARSDEEPALAIDLSAEERQALERLQRASVAPAGAARRARVVLLVAAGRGREVGERTGYTPMQVSRIRHHFARERLAGLADRPRSVRPQVHGKRMRAKVVGLTLKPPPEGQTSRTAR